MSCQQVFQGGSSTAGLPCAMWGAHTTTGLQFALALTPRAVVIEILIQV